MNNKSDGFSYNKYDNKNIRDYTILNKKRSYLKMFLISVISTVVFFLLCFLLQSKPEETTFENCRETCNGSFSFSNGICKCSN